MGVLTLLALAVALALDAFAVAVVSGLSIEALTKRHVFRLAFHFGLFQALMPVIGWVAGRAVHERIAHYDHWIALALLGLVGGKMIVGAFREDDAAAPSTDPTKGWTLVMLSIATSIDALAVGLSLAMIGSEIVVPALVIGVVAAAFTAVGMLLGRQLGGLWGKRVEVVGGIVLVGIGLKIVVEHVA
jgi:putative Mn2+ efflux pump MntP